jgi:di/tripeptidase
MIQHVRIVRIWKIPNFKCGKVTVGGNYNSTYDNIYVAFVCDEEVGKGSALVNYDKFKADYIFVLDGEFAGEIHLSNMSSFFVE